MGFVNSSETTNQVIVAGRIAADGTTTSGSGFMSAVSGTGSYTITLDREFNGCIAAVATAEHTSGDEFMCIDTVGSFPTDAAGAVVTFQGYDATTGTDDSATAFSFILVLTEGDA